MSKKKLSIILTLVFALLLGSGVVYYKSYTTAKSNVAKTFKSEANKSSPVVSNAIKDTEKELSSKDNKDKKEVTTKVTNLAVENVDYKYISYVVKKGDTLWSIASKNLPTCKTTGVVKDIREKNNLNSEKVKAGQKLTIPATK